MGSLGFSELLIILVIILIIFGAGKLPQIGEGLGRAIQSFRKASSGEDKGERADKAEPKPDEKPG